MSESLSKEQQKRMAQKERLELVAGVEFDDIAFEELEEWADYCLRYANPQAEGARYPWFMAPDFRLVSTQRWRHEMLQGIVEGVEGVWRDSGGQGKGTWFDMDDPLKNGALIRLILELFQQAGVKAEDTPDARTLRRAAGVISDQDSDTTG